MEGRSPPQATCEQTECLGSVLESQKLLASSSSRRPSTKLCELRAQGLDAQPRNEFEQAFRVRADVADKQPLSTARAGSVRHSACLLPVRSSAASASPAAYSTCTLRIVPVRRCVSRSRASRTADNRVIVRQREKPPATLDYLTRSSALDGERKRFVADDVDARRKKGLATAQWR